MTVRAVFVGIDSYSDPTIPDLVGARRDATALWALFSDSVEDIRAVQLCDDRATLMGVRSALEECLGSAGAEDVVIVSFSGHGTHDHRLVLHDTQVGSLADTCISMKEIAERFRNSKARAIFCVLDCCFSGAAPARVLEDSPIPRDISATMTVLAGTGRILLAASAVDEPAYESPTQRHGLLTRALLDVLLAIEAPIGVHVMVDRVMELIRAEASRMGVSQTPVCFGIVEGGLLLQPLRPGARFRNEFRETPTAIIGRDVKELSCFGVPTAVVEEWAKRFDGKLNDMQVVAINEYQVMSGRSLIVVAPTSSGKTFVGEMSSVRAVLDGRKAVFLMPYKALVNEKFDQFTYLYGEKLGFRVIRCSGDYVDQVNSFMRGKYDIAFLTYEMFLGLCLSNPSILNQIGLVVLDEAQFLSDPGRGITVELLLTYVVAMRERGIEPQLVVLSAVIGNINDFDKWLKCRTLISDHRPVPLVEGVLDRHGTFEFQDEAGKIGEVQLLPAWEIKQRKDKPSSQDVIVPLVRMLVQRGEKVIVFRNRKGSAQGCASYLSHELGLPATSEWTDKLSGGDPSATLSELRACMNRGTAFHDTNLTARQKVVVEHAFRDPDSSVRALAATSTVAAGINTPADTVVIAEHEVLGKEKRPLTVGEYKNMAGRAGRLGYRPKGTSILLAENSYQRKLLLQKYVRGQLEPFQSSFESADIETWLVRLLAQVREVPRSEVARLLASTYSGFLQSKTNPTWFIQTQGHVDRLITQMISLDLVEQEGLHVRLTLLGRACGLSALSFRSSMRLLELLKRTALDVLRAVDLVAILQILPEADAMYTATSKKEQKEAIWPRQASNRYGFEVVRMLQRYASEDADYHTRCKRAALLWDWMKGLPVDTIEKTYSRNPFYRIGYGDIRSFTDGTRFYLGSALSFLSVLFGNKGPNADEVGTTLNQLEFGLPTDALDLLLLPVQLERGEYLDLYNRGIKNANHFWSLPADSLENLLGPTRSQQFQNFRPTSGLIAT